MFDPHEFLTVAKNIDASASTEAEFRNCIGRAYYAAFLIVREYGHRKRIPRSTTKPNGERRGSHEQVIDSIQLFSDPKARFFKNELYTLKSLRVKADYKLGSTLSSAKARQAVMDAEAIIKWVDGLPQ